MRIRRRRSGRRTDTCTRPSTFRKSRKSRPTLRPILSAKKRYVRTGYVQPVALKQHTKGFNSGVLWIGAPLLLFGAGQSLIASRQIGVRYFGKCGGRQPLANHRQDRRWCVSATCCWHWQGDVMSFALLRAASIAAVAFVVALPVGASAQGGLPSDKPAAQRTAQRGYDRALERSAADIAAMNAAIKECDYHAYGRAHDAYDRDRNQADLYEKAGAVRYRELRNTQKIALLRYMAEGEAGRDSDRTTSLPARSRSSGSTSAADSRTPISPSLRRSTSTAAAWSAAVSAASYCQCRTPTHRSVPASEFRAAI